MTGTFVKSADPAVAEALAAGGLRLLVADLAHSALTLREVEGIVRAADVHGADVLVRIEPDELGLIGRILETGAAGVQVTDVTSPELVAAARAALAYPPAGTRSLSLSHRAARYGAISAPDAVAAAGDAVLVAQLESRAGLAALEALLAAPEQPDAWFLGPMDLSADLGRPGDLAHPEVVDALQRTLTAVLDAEATLGVFAGSAASAQDWRDRGASLLVVASDVALLASAARSLSPHLQEQP